MPRRRGVVQSIVVPRELALSRREARALAASFGGTVDFEEETETAWRFRQVDPGECIPSSFRTFTVSTLGLRLIYCRPRR